MPEKIANAPELFPGLAFYYNAFLELSTCRIYGMGMLGPVPWSSIKTYAECEGISSQEDFDLFCLYIREMDSVFMKHMSDKLKNQGKK